MPDQQFLSECLDAASSMGFLKKEILYEQGYRNFLFFVNSTS